MSDLRDLLAGAKPAGKDGADNTEPKKKNHPKPAWVAHREEVTGINAQYDEGERRWIFPGLSSNMGGPKKDARAQDTTAPNPKQATNTDAQARSAFASGDYAKVVELLSKDPNATTDPKKKALLDVANQAIKG